MTKKIFRSILLVAGTVLLASLIIIWGCLYGYFAGVQETQLQDELGLAAVLTETDVGYRFPCTRAAACRRIFKAKQEASALAVRSPCLSILSAHESLDRAL